MDTKSSPNTANLHSNHTTIPMKGSNKSNIIVATLLAIGMVSLCCLIAFVGTAFYFFNATQEVSRPVVLINTPHNGDTLYIGETVSVQSVLRDDNKVMRGEFWVNDELQHVEKSSVPGGISPMPLLIDWRPNATGEYNLTVRGFNSEGIREQASITINAVEKMDRDKDGVADGEDNCPDQPGSERTNGCPDRDGDGIEDPADACPEVAGLAEGGGCPVPSESDIDGDGLLDIDDDCPEEAGSALTDGCPDSDGDRLPDDIDECPEEFGSVDHNGCPAPEDSDYDSVPDSNDECPDFPGTPEHRGCPDGDEDGVRDLDDTCPDEPGFPEYVGCPDTDSDGVPDNEDDCPFTPGFAENRGCPFPSGGGDSGEGIDGDGDGVADAFELCPEDPGSAEHDGCPLPSDDIPSEDEDIVDFILSQVATPLFPGLIRKAGTVIEFQALQFSLNEDFDTITCYAGLAGAGMERWGPFDLEGVRDWYLVDISDMLGGSNSRFVTVPTSEELEVRVNCAAEDVFQQEAGGSWGTYNDLGGFTAHHSELDWHGEPIRSTSVGGDGGHSFEAVYRICPGSCEPYDIPPATLTLFHNMSLDQHMLLWNWEGDRSTIEGFRIYVNGVEIRWVGNNRNSFNVREGLYPPCGERREFYVTAFNGILESPHSNTAYWTGEPCPRQFQIIFDRLITGSSWGQEDEAPGDNDIGPIYGNFFVSVGDDVQTLEFDGAETDWLTIFPAVRIPVSRGTHLRLNSVHIINDLFYAIRRDWRYGGYSAPHTDFITVGLDGNDDLSFGGRIKDKDDWTQDDVIFNAHQSISRAYDLVPREYTLSDRNITLVVRVEEINSP